MFFKYIGEVGEVGPNAPLGVGPEGQCHPALSMKLPGFGAQHLSPAVEGGCRPGIRPTFLPASPCIVLN